MAEIASRKLIPVALPGIEGVRAVVIVIVDAVQVRIEMNDLASEADPGGLVIDDRPDRARGLERAGRAGLELPDGQDGDIEVAGEELELTGLGIDATAGEEREEEVVL